MATFSGRLTVWVVSSSIRFRAAAGDRPFEPGTDESITKTWLESGSFSRISRARSLASSSRVLSLSLYFMDRLVSNTRPMAVGTELSPSGTCE